MITISAQIIMWVLLAAIAACAFMIGKLHGEGEKNSTIENTINFLVEGGFVRYQRRNGEIELIPLNDENN